MTYKFTVKMKPRRNLYGIHNDFSGVGGGLRRGRILIRNRDGASGSDGQLQSVTTYASIKNMTGSSGTPQKFLRRKELDLSPQRV